MNWRWWPSQDTSSDSSTTTNWVLLIGRPPESPPRPDLRDPDGLPAPPEPR